MTDVYYVETPGSAVSHLLGYWTWREETGMVPRPMCAKEQWPARHEEATESDSPRRPVCKRCIDHAQWKLQIALRDAVRLQAAIIGGDLT